MCFTSVPTLASSTTLGPVSMSAVQSVLPHASHV